MTTGFGEPQIALQARDALTRLMVGVLDQERPPYRYATVTEIAPNLRTCKVKFFPDDANEVPTTVTMGAIQPTAIGQVVRVAGHPGDYFVADVIGRAATTDRPSTDLLAPTLLLAGEVEAVFASWTDVSDATRYEIQFADNLAMTATVRTFETVSRAFRLGNLNSESTIYSRVRGLISTGGAGPWSLVKSASIRSFPTVDFSDGSPPASSPTPVLTGNIGWMMAEWLAVPNADLVTYEVHISTTSGFTPSASTKIGETTGTFWSIGSLPAGGRLAYDTTYFVRLIAKDADGSAPVGAQASGQIDRVDTGDAGQLPDIGDGAPPSTSPAVEKVTPGIGFLWVKWQHVSNPNALAYDLHISTVSDFTPTANTLVGQTPSTFTLIRAQGPGNNGDPLVNGTTYYVKIWARDVDGYAPAPGAQGFGAPLRAVADDINDNAISTIKMADAAVTAAKIGPGAVITTKIADSGVTTAKILDAAVSTLKIANSAVSTIKMADFAVNAQKIADNAVTVGKILDGAVTELKVANDAITQSKMNVQPGGLNLLTNSNFSDWVGIFPAGWSVYNNSAALQPHTITKQPGLYGPNTYRMEWEVANTSQKGIATSTNLVKREGFRWRANEQMVVSFWARASLSSPTSMGLFANLPTPVITAKSNPILSTVWQRYVFLYRRPSDTNDPLYISILSGQGGVGWLEIDAVMVQTGDLASHYEPRADEILPGSIGTNSLADLAVTTGKIVDGAMTEVKIATSAITTTKIDDNAITTPKLIANVVTADKILAGAVVADKIAANAVTAVKITAGAVEADKIAANAVTATKIISGAITADKIAANAVVADKIAVNAVTASKIAANTITATQIAAATITATQIAAATITGDRLVANTIQAREIAANTVTATEIAGLTITAGEIAANAITAAKILAGSVVADKIAANSVTADKIQAASITAIKIAANVISAKHMVIGSFENLISDPNFAMTFDSAPNRSINQGATWEYFTTSNGRSGNQVLRAIIGSPTADFVAFEFGSSRTVNDQHTASEGDRFHAEIYIRAESSGDACRANIRVTYYNITNGSLGTRDSPVLKPNDLSWTKLETPESTAAAPPGTAYVVFSLIIRNNGTSGVYPDNNLLFDSAYAREMIEGTLIVDGTIKGRHVESNTITANEIATGTITASSGVIADLAIGNALIATAAISEAKIASLAVSGAKIQDASIGTAKIADLSVLSAKIGNLAVTNAKIADLSVTAAKIASLAVTNAEIASLAVSTAKIQDLAVSNAKVGNLSAGKITADTMNAARISGGDINGVTITGVTITGGVLQTSGNGNRVRMLRYSTVWDRLEWLNGTTVRGFIHITGSVNSGEMELRSNNFLILRNLNNSGYIGLIAGQLQLSGTTDYGMIYMYNESFNSSPEELRELIHMRSRGTRARILFDTSTSYHIRFTTGLSGIKLLAGTLAQVQCRNGNDTDYIPIRASAFSVNSSRTAKKNIRDAPSGALDQLVKSKVHRWKYDQSEYDSGNGSMVVGDPAEHLFPMAEDMPDYLVHIDEDGELSVDIRDTIGFLWKSIQELAARVPQPARP